MQLSNSGVNRLTWWAVGGAPNFTLQEDSIRTSWMDGHVLQGVPAALQPVRTGSHGSCVTARVAFTAGGSTVDYST